MELTFRLLERRDLALLAQWLRAPHVATWWREEGDLETIEARYGPAVDGLDPTQIFVVEYATQPIGLIQRYRLSDNPEWQLALATAVDDDNAVGIDYFIGIESFLGRGLGTAMITQFVRDTWAQWPDVATIVVSVQQENPASWRTLEKAGFMRAWSGVVDSDDPSDDGLSFIYVCDR